jgi:hypothetical protein
MAFPSSAYNNYIKKGKEVVVDESMLNLYCLCINTAIQLFERTVQEYSLYIQKENKNNQQHPPPPPPPTNNHNHNKNEKDSSIDKK